MSRLLGKRSRKRKHESNGRRPVLLLIVVVLGCILVALQYANAIKGLGFPLWDFNMINLGNQQSSTSSAGNADFERDHYDICVVGAGLSGAVLAEQFASQLGKTSLVIEKRNHVGGNCYDYVDAETNILVHKYGAHLFHADSHRVWDYIQRFGDWEPHQHRVLAKVGDKHVPVPVNIDTVNALFPGTNLQTKAQMNDWLQKEQTHFAPPQNAEEMALSRVGQRLYKLIFKPYFFKQWAKVPAELGPELTAAAARVRETFDERYFDDVFQLLPAKGYTAWFQELFRQQKDYIEVHTNVDYFDVREQLQGRCGHLFYAGPMDAYFADKGWDKLEYRSIEFERRAQMNIGQGQTALPASVVHYPEADYNYTRMVEYKQFLNQQSQHTVLFAERSSPQGEPFYPVPSQRNKDLYAKYQTLALQQANNNVTFVGGLASYKQVNMGQSIQNALELFDRKAPKLLIKQWWEWQTGGPEAIIQLTLAFYSWMPTRTFVQLLDPRNKARNEELRNEQLAKWLKWYPTIAQIPEMQPEDLGKGDILIVPEAESCPQHLVQKGVRVYIWWLGSKPQHIVQDSIHKGCEYLSHNFWLSHAQGVKVPSSHVLLPYMNPEKSGGGPINNTIRENLVIVNTHDNLRTPELNAINQYCEDGKKCTVQLIKGFTNQGLVELYKKAKIVVAMCMRGSERCPIEAALGGVVLVSNPCQSASDTRDFPIPQENIITDKNPASQVVERILQNFEHEQQRMEGMRQLYGGLGHSSLQKQTKDFMFALDKVKANYLPS